MTVPTFLPYFVFAGTAATVIAILYGLHRSLVEAGWRAAERARTFRVSAGTGFVTAPSLVQPIEVQPTSELMTVLPMVLIPVYLVPVSILLHLASLAKLRREAVAGKDQDMIVAARA